MSTVAEPEREGRLIVMGGTTEPGVFQVEITRPGHPLTGSILHVFWADDIGPLVDGDFAVPHPDTCRRMRITEDAMAALASHGLPVYLHRKKTAISQGILAAALCTCKARRIE